MNIFENPKLGDNLETARLILRPFTLNDIVGYHKVFSDPEVTKYVPWGPYTSVEETEHFILRVLSDQQKQPRTNYEFALELKTPKELIGYCILQVNTTNRSGERGIFLKKSEWNKGLATESQSAILDFGFGQLGLHRIWATCDPNNGASITMILKTGMKYEGRLRSNIWLPRNHTFRDSFLFSILEDEWIKLRSNRKSV